jgi:hypothetical protein
MSYELSVFGTVDMTSDALAELIRASTALDVDDPKGTLIGPATLSVVRGSRRVYSFSVEGPFHVEPEDVPEDVTAAVLDVRFMYQVLVEGGATEIPHAARMAKKLAKAAGGVMLDAQTDEIWPKTPGRKAPRPEPGEKPDEVNIRWYFLTEDMPQDLPARLLKLAKTYLPEAAPRRFGSYEPLQGRLDRDGEKGFLTACHGEPGGTMFFTTGYPVLRGSLTLPNPKYRRDIGDVHLVLSRDALADPAWRRALYRHFVGAAAEFGAFFASAEILRGTAPEGSFSIGGTEFPRYPVLADAWVGLPPYPQWWSWFGPLLADTVRPHLTGRLEEHSAGLFHSWSEEPLDRDQLSALLPDSMQPWVPAKHSANYRGAVAPVRSAAVMPERLSRNIFRTTDREN